MGYQEHPDLIKLCLNCTKSDCDGDCVDRRRLERRLIAKGEVSEKRNQVFYDWRGSKVTMQEWADMVGIDRTTASKKLKELGSLEALAKYFKVNDDGQANIHTYYRAEGKRMTMSAWGRELGVSYHALYGKWRCDKSQGKTFDETVKYYRVKAKTRMIKAS